MANSKVFTAQDILSIMRAEMMHRQMTQAEYALAVGCTPGHLSKVMSDKNPPTGAILAHLRLRKVIGYVVY